MATIIPDVIHFSPNFWTGRNNLKPLAIVNHVIQGTINSADSWFLDSASEVSAHFGISQDGKIYQWVRSSDTAWANGILENPDLSLEWLKNTVQLGINPNKVTVSIEHEGYTGKPFTAAAIQANIRLSRYLCAYWNIPKDREHFIGHYQITAYSRAHCPGDTFPYDSILSQL